MTDARRANGAAIAVILLAGALSTVWAFLVPIFQAPDEPAHFDYAISIYNAHRLIRVSDGKPDWVVSPYTKYLLRAVDFTRLATNSSMRAPVGYGATAYFARLDRDAPHLDPPLAPSQRINYVVPTYPFGFYALEALWMRTVSLFTGSLTAVFFSARLLCVFLTMLGLYFSYRIAINLRLPRWACVALVAAVAFLPLTSFVSSYVQPDNLAFALLSGALFFATRRANRLSLLNVAGTGILLGMLAVTKYHFFLAAAIPISLRFVVDVRRSRLTRVHRAALATTLAVPTTALLSIQHWIVDWPTATAPNPTLSSNFDYFRSVLAQGPAITWHYLMVTSAQAITDFFVSGPCAATFWQVFGWGDTPIFIVNDAAEMWIRAVIGLITVAVAVVLTFGLLRGTVRLLSLTARGKAGIGLALLVRDPVLNSYLLFVALMFGLYVLTNNAYGAEGRHWYPFVFATFLCFVCYAPRVLAKRSGIASTALACALLGYSVAAAGFALRDVAERYYGAQSVVATTLRPMPSQILPQSAIGNLWRVKSARYHVSDPADPVFPPGSQLVVSGIALPNRQGMSAVAAVADERTAIPIVAGEYQFVVAEASRDPAKAYGQFFGTLSTGGLQEGPHTITAYAALPNHRDFQVIAPIRLFFLTDADGRLSTGFTRTLEHGAPIPGSLGVAGACVGHSAARHGRYTVTSGGLLYLAGRIAKTDGRAYVSAWLLADRRPYPGRYNRLDGSFVATIPTGDLAAGSHRVSAYVIPHGSNMSVRIGQSATFTTVPGHGSREFLADPPAPCSDPLHQLASIQ